MNIEKVFNSIEEMQNSKHEIERLRRKLDNFIELGDQIESVKIEFNEGIGCRFTGNDSGSCFGEISAMLRESIEMKIKKEQGRIKALARNINLA